MDQRAGPLQRQVEVVDTEEQQQSVTGLRSVGARQGGMVVLAPQVQAQEHRPVRVEDLTEMVVGRLGLR